jgi:hypothetical protein
VHAQEALQLTVGVLTLAQVALQALPPQATVASSHT